MGEKNIEWMTMIILEFLDPITPRMSTFPLGV